MFKYKLHLRGRGRQMCEFEASLIQNKFQDNQVPRETLFWGIKENMLFSSLPAPPSPGHKKCPASRWPYRPLQRIDTMGLHWPLGLTFALFHSSSVAPLTISFLGRVLPLLPKQNGFPFQMFSWSFVSKGGPVAMPC